MTTRDRPLATGDPSLVLTRNAVFAVFALNGLAFANWISRIPAIRDELGLTAGQLGLLLLTLSAGSVLALPAAGAIVLRIGPGRTVLGGAVLASAGIVVLGVGGGSVGNVVLAAAGLFAFGAGSGVWDVAMNVEGADVERRLGRTIMPRFHAAWSLGSVTGAGLGALAAGFDTPLDAHLSVAALVILAGVIAAVRSFTPVAPAVDATADDGAGKPRHSMAAWLEPRTLLIGLLVLSAALTEGAANDWLALGLVDGYGASHAVAATGFAVFVSAMTSGRVFGTWFLDRYGRVVVLRSGIAIAIGGLALYVFGGSLPLAMIGALLWGLGASLGFPVGMSAAADDGNFAAARVSVVASIGYTAFLAGPPLIGLLADRVGLPQALLVIIATLVLSFAVTASARPRHCVPAERS